MKDNVTPRVEQRLRALAWADTQRYWLITVGVIAGAFALLWAGVEIGSQRVSYAFRLVMTVDVDGEIRQGSGVIRISHKNPPRWLHAGLDTKVDGEAITADLGSRGQVFAALIFGPAAENDGIGILVLRMFRVNIFNVDERTAAEHPLPPVGAKAELAGRDIPTLVTFTDRNDPRSARIVSPEDFSKVFGEGVTLRGMSIEMTDAPVTRGIETWLPWLKTTRGYLSGQGSCRLGEPHCLQAEHFKQGKSFAP